MQRLLILAVALVAACTSSQAPSPQRSAPAIASDLATVTAPRYGARVTSPFRVTGVAPADWFFENQFPVRLIDAQGREIAAAPAHPRTNWLEPGPKEFTAMLSFEGAGPATLVLEQDMPGEGQAPHQVRIDVILGRD